MSEAKALTVAALRKPTRKKGDVENDRAVYSAIRQAIQSGLLPPGLKLQEPGLARVLGVSRERVRKALHRLAHERWLDLVPNRGAFVPTPSVEELHAIYEARRMIELGVTQKLAETGGKLQSRLLRAHMAAERRAAAAGDRSQVSALSAKFHFLLLDLCGNPYLTRMFNDLMTRSNLIFSLFAPDRLNNCAGPHDHAEIARTIIAGEPKAAVALMLKHLTELEAMLASRSRPYSFTSLDDVFAKLAQAGSESAVA